VIVYISIGNSDDKLTQREWSEFVSDVDRSVRWWCGESQNTASGSRRGCIHGQWLSRPDAPWQNVCWCVEYPEDDGWPTRIDEQKVWLVRIATKYRQDSIAWAEAPVTEFIGAAT
jgi:hypothetical protein